MIRRTMRFRGRVALVGWISLTTATLLAALPPPGTAEAAPARPRRGTKPPPREPRPPAPPTPAPTRAPEPEPEPEPEPDRPAPTTTSARRASPAADRDADENVAAEGGRERPWYNRSPVLIVGLGFHLDDGTMRGSDRRSILVTDETFEFSNDNKLYGTLGFLSVIGQRMRLGAVVRYFGSYDYKQQMGDNESEPRKLGQLFELAAQGEYLLPLIPRVQMTVGAQAGAAILIPGGQFEADIKMLQNQGASVWNVPRLGYLVGPRVGVRWALASRIYLRGDFDITWCQTFLYMTHDEVAGVDFEKKRRANVMRYVVGASFEVVL